MRWRTDDGGWNPYLAGARVGLLALASTFVASSLTDKSFKLEGVPPMWAERFGPSVVQRAL